MSELGAHIKKEREKKNISLEELHEETKIRQLYLEAIENGEFSTLPGEVYLKGFLRTISRELSLEYGDLLERYSKDIGLDHESNEKIDKPNKALREIQQEKSVQKRTIILIGGLLLLSGVVVALMMIYS